MDKNPKNQISIKINGQEKKLDSKEKEEPKTYSKGKENVDDDIQSPLQIDNKEGDESPLHQEVAATHEAEEEEEFSWVLPSDDTYEKQTTGFTPIEDVRQTPSSKEYLKVKRPKGSKSSVGPRNNFPLKTFTVSIIMAVIVGLSFGAIILKLMAGVGAEQVTAEPELPVTSPVKEEDKPAEAATSGIDIPAITAAFTQVGVFKSEESALTTVDSVKSSGFPAGVVEIDGSYHVIIALGSDKGKLSNIESDYFDKVAEEPYSKPYEISGGSFEKVNAADASYISDAQTVFSKLIEVSSSAFASGSITDDQWKSVADEYGKLKASKDMSESLSSFSKELTGAFEQLKVFKDNKDQAALLKSQQSLLNALAKYNDWKNSLS